MKISLQMIKNSIVLCFGLSIGLTNAATPIVTTSNGSKTDTIETRKSALALSNANTTAVDLFDSTITIAAAGTTTNTVTFSDKVESIPAETASIQRPSSKSKPAEHTVSAAYSTQISTHQSYAMLLVGIGLLLLSARHRTNTI